MADSSTKSIPIESITLVPTAGETAPTSVVVDVTASCPDGVSELKRIQRYSSQLFIPEEMIYGNDLIKVWNIDDERQVEDDRMDVTLLKEEATFDKLSVAAPMPAPQPMAMATTNAMIAGGEEHKKKGKLTVLPHHHHNHHHRSETTTTKTIYYCVLWIDMPAYKQQCATLWCSKEIQLF